MAVCASWRIPSPRTPDLETAPLRVLRQTLRPGPSWLPGGHLGPFLLVVRAGRSASAKRRPGRDRLRRDNRRRRRTGPRAGRQGAGRVQWRIGARLCRPGGGHGFGPRASPALRRADRGERRHRTLLPPLPGVHRGDLGYPATYAAVDLAFTDGTYLSDLGARDQHGFALSPPAQGASKHALRQPVEPQGGSRIGDGRRRQDHRPDPASATTTRTVRPTSAAGSTTSRIARRGPRRSAEAHLSDYALTTRGTNSSGGFSRGNNFPATAVPHGFNFWTPVTNAGSTSWLYEYARANNADNLPDPPGVRASHEPSPWMGDRQTFQVMPSTRRARRTPTGSARALPFRHENEIARPYYYGVTFDNGIKAEIAPTDHAAMLRFTFPGDDAQPDLRQRQQQRRPDPRRRPAGVVTGFSDVNAAACPPAPPGSSCTATFDQPVTGQRHAGADGNGRRRGYLRFDASADRTVTLRIATSLISVDQAEAQPASWRSPPTRHASSTVRGRGPSSSGTTSCARDRGRGRDARTS